MQHRQRRDVAVTRPVRRGPLGAVHHLRPSRPFRRIHGRQRTLGQPRPLPRLARSGAAHCPPAIRRSQRDRAATHGRQREQPSQQLVQHHTPALARLKHRRQAGQRAQTSTQILLHQQQDPQPHREHERDVEVVSDRVPDAARPQKRVVQVVRRPQHQRDRQERGGP